MFDFTNINNVYRSYVSFLEKIAKFYQHNLFEYPATLKYVTNKRQISAEMIEKFNIGYSGNSSDLLSFIHLNKLQEDLLYKTGIFKVVDNDVFDYFYDRIIFPIQDINDNTIGFSARIWKDDQEQLSKFINSPDTEIFKKALVLYGLNFAIKEIQRKDFVWIVEGIPDVIACNQAGIFNVVSPGGTSITKEQLLFLRYFTNNIALCLDNDKAGRISTQRTITLLRNLQIHYKNKPLPDYEDIKDPDELLHKKGQSYLIEAMKSPF